MISQFLYYLFYFIITAENYTEISFKIWSELFTIERNSAELICQNHEQYETNSEELRDQLRDVLKIRLNSMIRLLYDLHP